MYLIASSLWVDVWS